MIAVHRLKGDPFFLNADLIEHVEALPDTMLTLVDGRKFCVAETPEEIVERIRDYKASILVAADQLRAGAPANLTLLHGDGE